METAGAGPSKKGGRKAPVDRSNQSAEMGMSKVKNVRPGDNLANSSTREKVRSGKKK